MKLPKTQEQIIIASNPTASPLPITVETLKVLIVYGGVSVATILAMTFFVFIFLEGLRRMLPSSNQQQKTKTSNNVLNRFLNLLNYQQGDDSKD